MKKRKCEPAGRPWRLLIERSASAPRRCAGASARAAPA